MLDFSPHSTNNPFRARRVKLLAEMIGAVLKEKSACRILDVGGTRDFWYTWRDHLPREGVTIECVNIDEAHASDSGYTEVKLTHGDARDLSWIADRSYDIAFSNSVIEHVGLWTDMMRMATEIRRVADRYTVQTPYFWFPIEPHMRAPFVHWLPEPLAYRLTMKRRLGFYERQQTVDGAMGVVQDAHLLDCRQMRALFPDAVLHKERMVGLVKSLTAIRG